jgi:hypothetical protein
MMVERYPNLKEEVGNSIPSCEISSPLDRKKKLVRASPPILQNAGWIILTISSSQLVCKPGDPPMTCIQGDKTRKKQKQDESHWHLGNRRGIWSLSFFV